MAHSHLAVSDIAVAAADLAAPGARLVCTVHNAGVELGRVKTALWHLALRRFDRVLAVSASVVASLPKGRPLAIVRPNVLEDDVRPMPRSVARARLGVPEDTPLVMAVGRLVPVKGFDVLADAAGRLRTKGARVILIGEGPEAPRSSALARAIDDLLGDPVRREAMGAAGQARPLAEGFSRRSMVERTRASYG